MKQLRFEDKWRKVVAASPLHAHWLDGDPAGGFEIMSGVLDRYRRFVVDGKPVATGILPVADAWASTNPSLGRGVALGIWHAQRLRDHVRGLDGDHSDFVLRWDEVTESELTPWYRGTIALDRARFAEIEALREGREPPDPRADLFKMGLTAASTDADMFRAFIEVMSCLATPEDVFSRPGIAEKFEAATRDGPLEIPGPDRAKLLELVA